MTAKALHAEEASRFLIQATFGPTDSSIAALTSGGYDAWFQAQENAASHSHLDWVTRRDAEIRIAATGKTFPSVLQFQESFWAAAVTGEDQLRQRMAFALSQIFVVSFQEATIKPRIGAAYYDMLTQHAFGNYFDLLKAVTLSPAMGYYLNIVRSKEADHDPSRHPDENYAREIMQLMSIGLVMLNPDGTPKLDASGKAIPTYGQDDIAGLAKVFTGWNWHANNPTFMFFRAMEPGADVLPLIAYPQFHSKLSKTFLGATLPAYSGAGALGDGVNYQTAELDSALKVIFKHPNVGPFIGRRLIQRFVTSNPSPGYVRRVAATFDDNGRGVRGDLFATLRAVLMDDEARGTGGSGNPEVRRAVTDPHYGKLREPVIRLANWLRAFRAASRSGNFLQPGDLNQPGKFNQAPLMSATVFNFWTPAYAPPGSRVAGKGLVAPEFQAVDALTSASYINQMLAIIQAGTWDPKARDVVTTYAAELALAPSPSALIPARALTDRMDLLLCGGQMSLALRGRIMGVLNTTLPAKASPSPEEVAAVNLDRVRNAVSLTMVSTDYLIQR